MDEAYTHFSPLVQPATKTGIGNMTMKKSNLRTRRRSRTTIEYVFDQIDQILKVDRDHSFNPGFIVTRLFRATLKGPIDEISNILNADGSTMVDITAIEAAIGSHQKRLFWASEPRR